MSVLALWQRNTLTGEPEQLGTLRLTPSGLLLHDAADNQRAWLVRIVAALNRNPPHDLPALRARLAGTYNLLVRPAGG